MARDGFAGRLWETGTAQHCPNLKTFSALAGLGVCDGAHRLVVMKKDRGRIAGGDDGGIPRLEKPRDGRPQSQGITGFVLFCIVAIGEL